MRKFTITREIKASEACFVVIGLLLIWLLFLGLSERVRSERDRNQGFVLDQQRQDVVLKRAEDVLMSIETRLREVEKWRVLAQAFQDSIIAGRVLEGDRP